LGLNVHLKKNNMLVIGAQQVGVKCSSKEKQYFGQRYTAGLAQMFPEEKQYSGQRYTAGPAQMFPEEKHNTVVSGSNVP